MIPGKGWLCILFFALIVFSSGCLSPAPLVRDLDGASDTPVTVSPAGTVVPVHTSLADLIPPTPSITRRNERTFSPTHSLSPTSTPLPSSPLPLRKPTPSPPKFKWGDILEDARGTRYIVLEGNPAVSGSYTAYKIRKCPCVELVFLAVEDTDGNFRKVDSQHPMTICNQSVLEVLKDPGETCEAFTSVSIDGRGNARRSLSIPSDGRFLVTGLYSGEQGFTVTIIDKNGDRVASVFNAVGPSRGSEVVRLEEGRYTVVVRASGPWEIDISKS
jgi:hypothetical protein